MSRTKRRVPIRKPIPASKIGKAAAPQTHRPQSGTGTSPAEHPYNQAPWYRYEQGWNVADSEPFRVSLGGWPGTPGATQTGTTLQHVCQYANRTRYADRPPLSTATLAHDIINIDVLEYRRITYTPDRPANIELGPDVDVDHLLTTTSINGFLHQCMDRLLDSCVQAHVLRSAIVIATRYLAVDDPGYNELLNEIFAELMDELDAPLTHTLHR